jgi:hypothetical protein
MGKSNNAGANLRQAEVLSSWAKRCWETKLHKKAPAFAGAFSKAAPSIPETVLQEP